MNNAEIVETCFVPFPCCAAAPPLSKVVVNMFTLSIVVGTTSGGLCCRRCARDFSPMVAGYDSDVDEGG